MATAQNKKFHIKESVEKHYDLKDNLGRYPISLCLLDILVDFWFLSGTFSTVRKGVHKKTGDVFAIKIIDKKAVGDKTEMIQTEIDILRKVRHPYIIGLKEMFETPTSI